MGLKTQRGEGKTERRPGIVELLLSTVPCAGFGKQ